MTKIQNSKRDIIDFVLAFAKCAILLSPKQESSKTGKLRQLDFLIWPVSVIDYRDLGFICYLVLVIWNLNHTGPTLFFVFCLLRFDMRLTWSS